ncbi:MAG: hypothetical protein GX241_02775 [Ruminococcaceae bacterium]|nr:hypothetical protein [Oscillospiraceae bacterium]
MEVRKMPKKSFSASFLYDDKVLIIVSLFLAFIIWVILALSQIPETETVIEHVKVQIDTTVPSQLGYEAFDLTDDEMYVDVTVKGKRYVIGSIEADDIVVTASTGNVDSPGLYNLQLVAAPKNDSAEFEIKDKTRDVIDIYYDVPKDIEIPIEVKVICDKELLYSNDYITTDPIASIKKIKIVGPATEVTKINRAVATVNTEGRLRETKILDAAFTIMDAYGAEVKYCNIPAAVKNMTVTIPVYKNITLPVTAELANVPTYYLENPPKILISPSTINIAVDTKKIDDLKEVSLGNIDFEDLKVGINTLRLDASKINVGLPANPKQEFLVSIDVEPEPKK